MVDPVTTVSGHTYERSYISEWLTQHRQLSLDSSRKAAVDPLTRQPLSVSVDGMNRPFDMLFPNHALRGLIAEFKANALQNAFDPSAKYPPLSGHPPPEATATYRELYEKGFSRLMVPFEELGCRAGDITAVLEWAKCFPDKWVPIFESFVLASHVEMGKFRDSPSSVSHSSCPVDRFSVNPLLHYAHHLPLAPCPLPLAPCPLPLAPCLPQVLTSSIMRPTLGQTGGQCSASPLLITCIRDLQSECHKPSEDIEGATSGPGRPPNKTVLFFFQVWIAVLA
jgi:hypothetical protein